MRRSLVVVDSDANGVEMMRFEMPFDDGPYAAGEHTLATLLETRLIADLERTQADAPEAHIALVQPLRSRESGDEIELFTPPMVDMQAQIQAARSAFEQGDFEVQIDGEMVTKLDVPLDAATIVEAHFVRFSLIIGG